MKRLRTSVLAGNVAALYGAHLVGMAVPILTIPYLARVLRPEGWGVVVFAQSFAAWLILVLEFGFDLSGTRAVARVRAADDERTRVVAGIQGAKALVLVIASAGTGALFFLVPLFRGYPSILFWAWAYAVLRGLSPFWYFLGQERMRTPAVLDAVTKVLAAAGIFVWVHSPADGWRVLALQAGGAGVSLAIMTTWLYREVTPLIPSLALTSATLKDAVGVFIFRASSGLYIQANAFVLGLMTTPQVVAFFGGAEKIVRAAINLLHPLSQALFPRLSLLVVADPIAARRVFRWCLAGMLALGLAMGVTAFWAAGPLVALFLGPGYEAAVPVLRILAVLPPVVAVGTVFGIHWALPMGFDRPFYRLVLAGGALNLTLAVVLAPRFGAPGMAFSVVAADVLVSAGLLLLFWSQKDKRSPLRSGQLERHLDLAPVGDDQPVEEA